MKKYPHKYKCNETMSPLNYVSCKIIYEGKDYGWFEEYSNPKEKFFKLRCLIMNKHCILADLDMLKATNNLISVLDRRKNEAADT